MKTISFQPGQLGEGMNYNVHKPLPRPILVDTETCSITFGRDVAVARFLGLQDSLDEMSVDHLPEEVFEDLERAAGKHIVLLGRNGKISTIIVPIISAREVTDL